jgi:hypothetical protein
MAKVEKAKEPRERYQVRMVAATEQMLARAEKNKAGKYVAFAYHSIVVDGKRKPGQGRGATTEHRDFASARTAVDAIVAAAIGKGWTRKTARSRTDAFDLATLPAPSSLPAPAK